MAGLIHFSQDAASNDVGAPPINWREGQPSNSVNNSARELMAALANWHADVTGSILATVGASTIAIATDNDQPLVAVIDGIARGAVVRATGEPLGPQDLRPGRIYRSIWNPTLNRHTIVAPTIAQPGTIILHAGATPPPGYVPCDGRILSRTDYAALFSAIGTTHGSTGATDFRVPDMRGRAPFCVDAFAGGTAAGRLTNAGGLDGDLGDVGGAETVTLTDAQMPSHTHTGSTAPAGAQAATTTGAAGAVAAGTTGSGGGHSHTGTTDTGGGHSHSGSTSTAGAHVHNQNYERLTLYGTGGALSAVTQLFPPGTNSAGTTESGGEHSHTFTTNSVAGHTHGLTTDSVSSHAHSIPAIDDHSHTIPAVPDHSHALTLNDTGGGAAHPNMPPGLVLIFAIKA
jgi:microcystin-dependent protein